MDIDDTDVTAIWEVIIPAGAAFLDHVEPGWRSRIDLDSLDMGDAARCIVGQVAGEYGVGLRLWGIDRDDAVRLGFRTPSHEADESFEAWLRWSNAYYRELRNAWLAELGTRSRGRIGDAGVDGAE